jgi:hypothetical protein
MRKIKEEKKEEIKVNKEVKKMKRTIKTARIIKDI